MVPLIFKLGGVAIASGLGPLESDVLGVLWTFGYPVPVSGALAVFEAAGRRPAHSTIKAILNNLTGKGVLRKTRDGRANLFSPLHTKAEFETAIVDTIVSSLLPQYRKAAFVHFVNHLARDAASLAEFQRLLADRRASC